MKLRFAVLLTALLFSALAFSQATLGNIVQLGTSTTAGLPASSSTIAGGLIYLSDDAGVLFNNGSAWVPLMSGSGSMGVQWVDAGIASSTMRIRPSDQSTQSLWLGPTLATAPTYIFSTHRIAMEQGFSIGWETNGSTAGEIVGNVNEMIFNNWDGTGNYHFQKNNSMTTSTLEGGTFKADRAAGSDAVLINTAGARLHLSSGGSLDYLVSDGTGLETPTYAEAADYVQGATGFCSGTACAGTAFASFPAANTVDTRLRYDSTNDVWRTSNGTTWATVAQEYTLHGYLAVSSPAAGYIVALDTTEAPASLRRLTAVRSALGVGGGNVVITFDSGSGGAAVCTLNIGCAIASATTTCTASLTAADSMQINVDTSACAPAPALNITAHFNGG